MPEVLKILNRMVPGLVAVVFLALGMVYGLSATRPPDWPPAADPRPINGAPIFKWARQVTEKIALVAARHADVIRARTSSLVAILGRIAQACASYFGLGG